MKISRDTLPLPPTVSFMSDESFNHLKEQTVPHLPPVHTGCKGRQWDNDEVFWLLIYHLWSGTDCTDIALREGCKPRLLQKWVKIGKEALNKVLPVLPDGVEITDAQQVLDWCEEHGKAAIVDVTEIAVAHPESTADPYGEKQRSAYSGKKKTHTVKSQVIADEDGNLLDVSTAVPGAKNDYKLFEESGLLDEFKDRPNLTVSADLAYVAIVKILLQTLVPRKKEKGKERSEEDKFWNKRVASFRVVVECAIGKLKRFKCLRKVKVPSHRMIELIRLCFIVTTYRQAWPQGEK